MTNFDLRVPIGLFFGLIGIAMTLYGAFSDKAIYARSLGININLGWGIVLLAFGGIMLLFAWRGKSSV